jgi:DNA-binding response OmpR family regulator
MKILMIDDDCTMFRAKFSEFPAEIFFAESEREGMKILSEQSVDAILMDGNLCSERNGLDVVKTLRESGLKMRIIMFSSNDDLNAEGIAVGADSAWNKHQLYEKGWQESLLEVLK